MLATDGFSFSEVKVHLFARITKKPENLHYILLMAYLMLYI